MCAGVDIGAQIRQLRKGIDVAVGTPGRFIDLINRGNMDLCMVRHSLRSITQANMDDRRMVWYYVK